MEFSSAHSEEDCNFQSAYSPQQSPTKLYSFSWCISYNLGQLIMNKFFPHIPFKLTPTTSF